MNEPAELDAIEVVPAEDSDRAVSVVEALGAEDAASTEERVALYPDLFVSGLTSAVVALCVYSLLCIFLPAGLDIRANPLAPPEIVKPAWYFLFLHRLLRSTPAIIGALAPVLALVALALWPFLDRNPSREPKRRIVALLFAAAVALAILALTYQGWVS